MAQLTLLQRVRLSGSGVFWTIWRSAECFLDRGFRVYLIKNPFFLCHFIGQSRTNGIKSADMTRKILVVDDEPDQLALLEMNLGREGFLVRTAGNAAEARAAVREERPDLILLDLRLPGMDGYESLTHLKRDVVTQTIPIIAVSAHASNAEQERNRLIALGASSFLPKPFSINELLTEIEAALQPISGPTPP